MPATSKRQVASLLMERRRAMGGYRFKPENYNEIQRVLGPRYAPDLNRVLSKHRADAASAYLRRLHKDVEQSHNGYYATMQAMPLQIKSLSIKKEDPRSFKSVLIPKLKLSSLDPTPSPRSHKSLSPMPPLLSGPASTYVPHKSFNPHSHTHIHVLFKQMPGSVTPRKGASSVVSSEKSGGRASSTMTDSKTKYPTGYKLSPRGSISKVPEEPEAAWPSDIPLPYAQAKFVASPAVIPHIKKRAPADKSPRMDKVPPTPSPRKSEESSPVNQFIKDAVREVGLPPKVAAALAAESTTAALYKFDLPAHLAASYNKNLPGERPKAMLLARHAHFPLPSIPKKSVIDNELLAIISVQHSNAIHVAA